MAGIGLGDWNRQGQRLDGRGVSEMETEKMSLYTQCPLIPPRQLQHPILPLYPNRTLTNRVFFKQQFYTRFGHRLVRHPEIHSTAYSGTYARIFFPLDRRPLEH